jgi:hypothetical protein
MLEKTVLLYVPVPVVMGEAGLSYESHTCTVFAQRRHPQ